QVGAALRITREARGLDAQGNRSHSALATTSRPTTSQATTRAVARLGNRAIYRPMAPTRRTIHMRGILLPRRSSAPAVHLSAPSADAAAPISGVPATSAADAHPGAATAGTTTRRIHETGGVSMTGAA